MFHEVECPLLDFALKWVLKYTKILKCFTNIVSFFSNYFMVPRKLGGFRVVSTSVVHVNVNSCIYGL